MKFGQFNLMTAPEPSTPLRSILTDTVTQVRLAEEMGFDVAWFAEHHFTNYSVCCSPLMMASWCAAQTSRIRLGPAVLVLPLYNPIRVMEEIALADLQSDGRIVIGLGSGYQEYEFTGFGLDIESKLDITHEMWDIIEMGLTTGEVEYEGTHFSIPKRSISLRPLQRPMPDVFVAGVNPSLIERMARSRHTPFVSTGFRGMDKLMELRTLVEDGYRRVGETDIDSIPFALQRYIHITNSRAEALKAAEHARFVGRTVANMVVGQPQLDGAFLKPLPFDGEPTLEEIVDNLAIGDPETVAEKMAAEIRAARPTHYSCFFRFGPMEIGKALTTMERFGAEVIPLLEKELGPLDAIGNPAPHADAAQA